MTAPDSVVTTMSGAVFIGELLAESKWRAASSLRLGLACISEVRRRLNIDSPEVVVQLTEARSEAERIRARLALSALLPKFLLNQANAIWTMSAK